MKSLFLFAALFCVSNVSAFLFAGNRQQLKKEILDLASETKRGLIRTPEQEAQMSRLFSKLERLNPTPQTLKSPLINADWSLEYTTSDSILGKGGSPRVGPIVQTIDTTTLYAANSEVVRYFNILPVPRKITAALSPQTKQLTNVQFKEFAIGPLRFPAPESFRGYLDITYLDEDLRLTRGDKGNLFVLTRMT